MVERQIAKVGELAFGKAVAAELRAEQCSLSCHYDSIDWARPRLDLQHGNRCLHGRCHRQRPKITLEIRQTNWKLVALF